MTDISDIENENGSYYRTRLYANRNKKKLEECVVVKDD
jgi:hypothetical protein